MALRGTLAGAVYGELLRHAEGELHRQLRPAVERRLAQIDVGAVASDAAGETPIAVVARHLGVTAQNISTVVGLTQRATRAVGPRADPAPDQTDVAAVEQLLALLPGDPCLDAANILGLLVQTCVATPAIVDWARSGEAPAATTRRFDANGDEIVVDLTGRPFGDGRHRCPGEAIARALISGARVK